MYYGRHLFISALDTATLKSGICSFGWMVLTGFYQLVKTCLIFTMSTLNTVCFLPRILEVMCAQRLYLGGT